MFAVQSNDDRFDKKKVRVEVVGPFSKPPVTLSWEGKVANGSFTPTEPGPHKVQILRNLLQLNSMH